MARFEQLLILVPWLSQRPGTSVSDAATHFGMTEAQLREDLTLLTLVGIGPFATEQFEISIHDDSIYVRDDLGISRAFAFDPMEAACLALGLELLEPLADAHFEMRDYESLQQKIQDLLPTNNHIAVVRESHDTTLSDAIALALRTNKRIRFNYHNNARDDLTSREVSPLSMRAEAGELFCDGWDHAAKGWRSYRLERMSALSISDSDRSLPDETFAPMPTTEVVLKLNKNRRDILEKIPSPTTVERADYLEVSTSILRWDWLARLIASAGGALTVISPESAQVEVSSHLSKALQAYS